MTSRKMEDDDLDQSEELDLDEEISKDQIAAKPSDTGDPSAIVEAKIPPDILERYDVYSYRNAAVILSETRSTEFNDLLKALRNFKITTTMIRKAGGNESEIPKLLSNTLRPLGWYETVGQALRKDGETPDTTNTGKPRMTFAKFGASTTWMGKLLYRLNAGRNGGCPVLVLGITPKCIEDWPLPKT